MRFLFYFLVLSLFLPSCQGQDNPTKNWVTPKKCGQFPTYPVYLTSQLPAKPVPSRLELGDFKKEMNNLRMDIDVKAEFQKAKAAWAAKGKSLGFNFFSDSMRSNTPVILVRAADAKHYRYGQKCELFHYKSDTNIDTMGWIEYRLYGAVLNICVEKFAHASQFPKSRLARHLNRIGLAGFIMHEIGHAILGPYHISDGSLMSAVPLNTSFSTPITTFLRERVVKPCRR